MTSSFRAKFSTEDFFSGLLANSWWRNSKKRLEQEVINTKRRAWTRTINVEKKESYINNNTYR